MSQITITQVAKTTPFDNSTNEFIATSVQDAIEEVRAAIVVDDGFSWNIIPSGKTVIVKDNRQMLSYQQIEIASTGELEVNGEVVVIL